MQNKEGLYFEFDNASDQRWFNGVFSFFKKEKFIFFKPLFEKLPKKESAYWVIVSFVMLCATGIILNFIDSYIKEIDAYQVSLSSVGRYESLNKNDENNHLLK
jgi:hypothetical protein